jgi:hypothetical protein
MFGTRGNPAPPAHAIASPARTGRSMAMARAINPNLPRGFPLRSGEAVGMIPHAHIHMPRGEGALL